jgi:hypothetical protein
MADHKGGAGGGSDIAQNGVLWGLVLAAILSALVWYKKKAAIQYGVLWLVYYGVYPFTAISHSANQITQTITSHPLDFWTPGRLFDLYSFGSSLFWRWPVIALLLGLGVMALSRSKRMRYGSSLTLDSLARMMVQENPHIAPTLKLNAYEQPLDGGILPAPERPISFATHRHLLIDGDGKPVEYLAVHQKNGTLKRFLPDSRQGKHPIGNYTTPARLHEEAASKVFVQQLSGGFLSIRPGAFDPRSDLGKLPVWALCLAAAIYAMGADMQDEGEKILRSLSLSWSPAQEAVEAGFAWPVNPFGWVTNDQILEGRIDWPATENPARPVEADTGYLFPSWGWSPVVSVRRSIKGFGRDIVVRPKWRWKGPLRHRAAAARQMGFGDLSHLPYKKILSKMQNDAAFLQATRLHNLHVSTWFMALMEWAQVAGSFHTSFFIWLRVQNPTLFWAMNQVGGECSWTQGAGPWAHYRMEIMARQAIADPCVDFAVASLEKELRVDGWLDPQDLR